MLGSSIGHYKVTAKLGQGGMGEVYRAIDTKLEREVAIKVLPAEFAQHPERLARFEREAKALARLNHPNIGAIHGFDQREGQWFIVLELIEGQTLADHLRPGPLPVEKALKVFKQIAEALEAAHEKDIVHRDLKPANIKIDPQGRVKVLDFGLAKARFTQDSSADSQASTADSMAPTITSQFTHPGKVMGTAAYMSPEQSRGQEVDRRTDVWAFGCCLYEALTGKKPFKGQTVSDLMADILKSDPDFTVIPPETPSEVLTLLRRCLEKDPQRRMRYLGDIALTLEDVTETSRLNIAVREVPRGQELSSTQGSKKAAWWKALAIVALAASAIMAIVLLKLPAPSSQIRSLAVLPFAFETQDPKLAGLGKQIPAEIRSKLGVLQNLQVVNSPMRIEQLLGKHKTEKEIAHELGVDGLVMGELHGQGEALSAYVWVVDGSTGHALGRQREIVSSVSEVSQLPSDVALAIVAELKLQVSSTQRTEMQEPDTQNSDAFLALQHGQDLLNQQRFDEAEVELRRAYQLDTNYTQAWAALARREAWPLINGGTTNEMATTFKRLLGEVERFRTRRPNDTALAGVRHWIAMLYERNWEKARTVFWDSQRNQKPDWKIWNTMSWYYTNVEGHPEQASYAIEQSIELDPENFSLHVNRASHLFHFGHYQEAASALRKIPLDAIQFEDFSNVLLMAGDLPGAEEVATRILAERPNAGTLCNLAAIHAKSGATDEARRILQELELKAEQGMHIPYAQIARSYGMLEDFESARRWLHRGLSGGQGDSSMITLRSAEKLEIFGKLPWYWEIVDGMEFPPLQMDHPYFSLEQRMRYGRGAVGAPSINSTSETPKVLAVLPFKLLNAGADDEGLSEGLALDLISVINGIRQLTVRSPDLRRLQETGKTDTAVAAELQASHILTGGITLPRTGDRLRVNWLLKTVADDKILWSTNYDDQAIDLLTVRDGLTSQVADALRVSLVEEEKQKLTARPTDSPEAYSLYVKGRAAWNKRTIHDFEQAIGLYERALEKDTNFALAYAGLADVHTLWDIYSETNVATENHPALAVAYAREALELDATLAEPHAAIGYNLTLLNRDWDRAENEYLAAIRLNPQSANAHHWYSELLSHTGRYDEALQHARRAMELDYTPINRITYHIILFRAGQVDRAIEFLETDLAENPGFRQNYGYLLDCYIGKGTPESYEAALKILSTMHGTGVGTVAQRLYNEWYPDAVTARIFARQGRPAEARQLLERVGRSIAESSEPVSTTILELRMVMALHDLGDKESTLTRLDGLIEVGKPVNGFVFPVLWELSNLYGEPRFRTILRKVNLDQYVPDPTASKKP